MPQRVNKEKSDLSVSLGAKLRKHLVDACAEDDNKSLSQAVREAVSNWLAARDRKQKRKAAGGPEGAA